jgi:beta-galactosidase
MSRSRLVTFCLLLWLVAPAPAGRAASPQHSFALGAADFLLDGKPFQMRSGEIHPARVPVEYWRHRIQMAKAMGMNTIAAYVFWNYHETAEGRFDFATGNRNLAQFVRLAQEEGLWVLLRPGPYVCAEWDFGGLPAYLLRDPELRIRCLYPPYMRAVERYIRAIAPVIRPLLVTRGGPILMVQIENEYGSFGNDRAYLERLRELWRQNGIDVPFYTADGPTPYMLEAGSLPGAAVGLDSGSEEQHWALARSVVPGVPVFSSETYPGWLTHWGETWAQPGTDDLLKELRFLLDNRKSFNFYVIHGGTNFGFTAGANSGGKGFEPDVTSYDYDAPINEQGRPTAKFAALRQMIAAASGSAAPLPEIPAPIPSMDVPPITMAFHGSIWDHLPAPVRVVQPRSFESLGQNQGLMLYRTTLAGRKAGTLVVTDLHDFATVFVDGRLIGTLDRRLGENTIVLPVSANPHPVLDILVEGMGHINFAQAMIDRKGITDRVTLGGMTLMNWDVYPLPLDDKWVHHVADAPAVAGPASDRPGRFFKGTFTLNAPADTFLDLSGYRKGVIWVNGHNLGRYWDAGPQTRLYCPAPWLTAGSNEIVVFDLLATAAPPVAGLSTLR